MSWSEDRLHVWLARAPKPRALSGSRGHDAAVLRARDGRTVACVDQCVEDVHFLAGANARDVGAKAAARALSDLAATAARPHAVLLALQAPRERDEAWMKHVIEGVRRAARTCGAELVGGDLCAAPGPASLAVTALGTFAGRGRPPGRDRARSGQRVVLTGPVGGSLHGRHLAIRPRIEAGERLHAAGATAMMDVSDGLAWDLYRLARASRVAIELDESCIPIHADARRMSRATRVSERRSPLDHALHDGEDHELVATLSATALARARRTVPGLVDIGRVVRGSGVRLLDRDGVARVWEPGSGGYRHGT